MSAVKPISATARMGVGKGAARAVRREGKVPAVIYGAGQTPVPISLERNQINPLVYAGRFLTTVFEVDLSGQKTRVIPRDYQLDPVRDTVEHVDFLRVSAGSRIRVEIPVHIINAETAPGIKAGGSVNIVTHSIALTVPADSIPESVDVDIGALNINDSLHLSQISLPTGARPVSKGDETLVSILPPQAEEASTPAQGGAASTTAAKEK